MFTQETWITSTGAEAGFERRLAKKHFAVASKQPRGSVGLVPFMAQQDRSCKGLFIQAAQGECGRLAHWMPVEPARVASSTVFRDQKNHIHIWKGFSCFH